MSNGSTFLGNIQVVSGSMVRLFNKIKIPDMLNHEVPIERFGGVCYANSPSSDPVLSDQAIADAVIAHRERKILFQAGNYVFSKTVAINRSGITTV